MKMDIDEFINKRSKLRFTQSYILDSELIKNPSELFSHYDNLEKQLRDGKSRSSRLSWSISSIGNIKNHIDDDKIKKENILDVNDKLDSLHTIFDYEFSQQTKLNEKTHQEVIDEKTKINKFLESKETGF